MGIGFLNSQEANIGILSWWSSTLRKNNRSGDTSQQVSLWSLKLDTWNQNSFCFSLWPECPLSIQCFLFPLMSLLFFQSPALPWKSGHNTFDFMTLISLPSIFPSIQLHTLPSIPLQAPIITSGQGYCSHCRRLFTCLPTSCLSPPCKLFPRLLSFSTVW